ncbi:hypothetical protein RUMHYD_03013 [Blautia hydrogenotrophica DSM 10507]|uniref:Uncharacterized protein n=1 Tax=Blautia hydrogenotrophica (strain DSM 10507 / JCM 14656 / S5a33) TaxID=476272 RepID=C0CQ60_BLAHS|nr:hypothetical protein RUMHYD_03013 [Blautia hydrogenotrophica DSM 10507]
MSASRKNKEGRVSGWGFFPLSDMVLRPARREIEHFLAGFFMF